MIKEISINEARDFFCKNKEKQITFLPKGLFFGFFVGNKLVGIVSSMKIGRYVRIKTILVSSEKRKNGIGVRLLKSITKKEGIYTAFSNIKSQSLFLQCGFKTGSTNKNNISFMRLCK